MRMAGEGGVLGSRRLAGRAGHFFNSWKSYRTRIAKIGGRQALSNPLRCYFGPAQIAELS
jgi:hypothetical protein